MATKRNSIPWKLIVRVTVSALLIYVVSRQINIMNMLSVVRTISLEMMFMLITLYFASQMINTFKWRIILDGVGIHRSTAQLIRATVFGMFVNMFGVGTVGADVARALALKPERGARTSAFASVVADRILGLGVLLSIGCAAILLLRPDHFPDLAYPAAILSLLGIIVFWIAGPALLLKLFGEGHRLSPMAIQAAKAFPRNPRAFFSAALISTIFHSVQIFMVYVTAQELHAPLTLAYLFATVPLVNALATLPLSIQGIGVRESMYVLFFTSQGVSDEVAVAFGAIWLVVVTATSAISGLLITPDLIRAGDKALDVESKAELIDIDAARESRRAQGN